LGGLVAYEVARQAVDTGQQIEWLGILDQLAPSMAQRQSEQLTLRRRLHRVRRLPARQRWGKDGEVALRVFRREELLPQNDFDFRGAKEIECRYKQPGHGAPMHLFVSEVSAADAEADSLGWDECHKGPLTVHRFSGDHFSLLQLPQAELLVKS